MPVQNLQGAGAEVWGGGGAGAGTGGVFGGGSPKQNKCLKTTTFLMDCFPGLLAFKNIA
jgi:hypothetical protein